jgi:hypothetical protein
MFTKKYFFSVLLAICFFSYGDQAAEPVQSINPLEQLKSPQPFSLSAGEQAAVVFPVTQPGTVTLDITWTGSPLTIVVTNQANRAITAPSLRTSPVRIQYSPTAAEVGQGIFWKISAVCPANAAGRPAAKGEIKVSFPPVDAAAFSAAWTQLQARHKQVEPTQISAPPVTQNEREATRLRENATLDNALLGQFQNIVNQVQAKRIATLPALRTQASIVTPVRPDINRAILTSPFIESVAPNYGLAGDTVKISARNVKADPTTNKVFFVVTGAGATSRLEAKIISATAQDPLAVFAVAVPPLPAGFQQVNSCTIELVGTNPAFTVTSQGFVWTNVPIAKVTLVTPTAARAGDYLVLKGENFSSARTRVHFSLPGNPDAVVTNSQCTGTTEMRVKVPEYSSQTQTNASLYVQTVAPNGTIIDNGAQWGFFALPTVPTLTVLDRTSSKPQQSLLIQGSGFASYCTAIFKTAGGQEYTSNPTSRSDSALVVKIPDIPLVPMGGINVMVSVRNSGSENSNTLALHLDPILDEILITDPSKLVNISFQKGTSDDFCRIYDPAGSSWDKEFIAKEGGTLFGKHESNYFGYSGFDLWGLKMSLKNGWRVSRVSMYKRVYLYSLFSDMEIREHKDGDPCDANVYSIMPAPAGGALTTIQIYWYSTPTMNSIMYTAGIRIEGPRGFPYE